MPAFTVASTSAKSMQTSALYNEIETSFWQKYKAMAPSTTPPAWCGNGGSGVHPGQNIQSATFWQNLQNGVGNLLDACSGDDNYFLRTTSAPPNYQDNLEDSMTIYSSSADLGALYLATLGNSGGPRRYVGGVATTRGIHVAGDDIGFWLIDDLQAILRGLKYTKRIVNGGVTGYPPHENLAAGPRSWKNNIVGMGDGVWDGGFWGIKASGGGSPPTSIDYDNTRKNINWTTGHDTDVNNTEGNVTRGYVSRSPGDPLATNRLSCICRNYYASNLAGRHNVCQYCERGYVEITGIPTNFAHSAELYGVMDYFHKPETLDHASPGVALVAGKHRITYTTQVNANGGSSNVIFKPIGYAGLVTGNGRYVKLQSFASAAVATRSYTHLSSPLQFPTYASAEYNLFSWGGNQADSAIAANWDAKNVTWYGHRIKAETMWVIAFAWTYT